MVARSEHSSLFCPERQRQRKRFYDLGSSPAHSSTSSRLPTYLPKSGKMSETKHHVFKCILYIEESATAKVNNFAMP
jgi:hypothetical protein